MFMENGQVIRFFPPEINGWFSQILNFQFHKTCSVGDLGLVLASCKAACSTDQLPSFMRKMQENLKLSK